MLTLQFIPYVEIENLSSADRIKKLIKIVKKEKIILLEGRLRAEEEAQLIKKTMEEIGGKFKGIELSVIYPNSKNHEFIAKLKQSIAKILLGDRQGLTVIGPASVVSKIKQDPDKIQLFTHV